MASLTDRMRMTPPRRVLAAVLLLLLVAGLAGCLPPRLRAAPSAAPVAGPEVAVETGSVASSTGCALGYRLYRPPGPAADGLVVLGHGFLRSMERMDGLARALADAGMTTVAVDFCSMRPWDGRHHQNGLDLVAVARALDAERVLYAGFSAGALAALVAGRADPGAVGVLALDLVDDGGLGLRTARALDKPLVGLMGEPTACNARGNGQPVLAAGRTADIRTIAGAGHCAFESPTDWLCRMVCEGPEGDSAELRARIIDESVELAAGLLGEPRPERTAAATPAL